MPIERIPDLSPTKEDVTFLDVPMGGLGVAGATEYRLDGKSTFTLYLQQLLKIQEAQEVIVPICPMISHYILYNTKIFD